MSAHPELNAILNQATTDAAASLKRVDRLAKLLAEEMQSIHGTRYRVQIEHECNLGFVFIVAKHGE